VTRNGFAGIVLCALLLGGALALGGGTTTTNASGPTVLVRVEGPASTIFQGALTLTGTVAVTADNSGTVYALPASTPLAALELASAQGGFDLQVTDQFVFFDLFVDSVGGIGPAGFSGWVYRVDAVLPYYGAGFGWQSLGPALQDGDEILWYWGMGEPPLRLAPPTLARTDVPFNLLVETTAADYFHVPGDPWPSVTWVPLDGATVHLGGSTADADASGHATFLVPAPGTYDAFAESSGYARSAHMAVTVALSVELRVNPQTIQRNSAGRWVSVWIETPTGFDPTRLDRGNLLLGGVTVAELSYQFGHVRNPPLADPDGDGLPEILVKFDRAPLAGLADGTYRLVLTGTYDGTLEVYGESQPVSVR